MGHRKHSAPRRGSLAFAPRARHQTLVPRVRTWATKGVDRPTLAGFPAFKVGMGQVITVDDREKTPNFGKPTFNAATIFAASGVTVCGFRAYGKDKGNAFVLADVIADGLKEELTERISQHPKEEGEKKKVENQQSMLSRVDKILDSVEYFAALVGVVPSEVGLSIDDPQVQEVGVAGGNKKSQLDFLKSILGKQVRATEFFKPGSYVDAIAITKGKGFEGVITRFGVKRKQHKSRKTVREVGVISPWHPATVMYTVPRAGQMGFHQRLSRNNRVLAVGNAQQSPITPSGGFPHFGEIRGDYLIIRGSVPGPTKRLVDLRLPLNPRRQKIQAPKIIELNVGGKSMPLLSVAQAK